VKEMMAKEIPDRDMKSKFYEVEGFKSEAEKSLRYIG
jgi:hypothetical protein